LVEELSDAGLSESDKRAVLCHFLAALAYRTQKALRAAPDDFGGFDAGNDVRTPKEIVRHMTSVLGYARTYFLGGSYRAEPLPRFEDEVARFHEMLTKLSDHLEAGDQLRTISLEQLLQGPLSDAMTHAGQLAVLRRLHGTPVPPENFIYADVNASNVGEHQAEPRRPDKDWPERR
jgi:hypothetical protein